MVKSRATNSFSDLNRLEEVVIGYRSSKPLLVALHFDLFSWISQGYDTASKLRQKLGFDLRAIGILLDALAALGFLNKRQSRYVNARLARKFLVSTSSHYMGNSLKYQELTWDAWSDLRIVLKTGRPRRMLGDWLRLGFFTKDYIRAMGDLSRQAAQELTQKLKWGTIERTLDIGCGAGTFSAAFVHRKPSLEAVLLDLPPTLSVTREILEGHPHRKRFRFQEANYLTDRLGREEFDLALISNVTRIEDEASNRKIIKKAYQALRPQGKLVIHDFAIDSNRTTPKFSALLALHVLLFTGKGAVYTVNEYKSWLRDVGLKKISTVKIAGKSLHPAVAIVGVK